MGNTQHANACYAFLKGTCTRGDACGFAHVKERGRSATPKPGPKSQKQCTFFAAGTCKLGAECRDKHGGGPRSASPKRKPKGKTNGDIPAAAAVAVSILKAHVPVAVPGSVALAASYDHGPTENCRSWLLDTGCKFDLTTRASVLPYLQNSIMKATVPITLSTANDLVNGDMVVRQQIMEFGEVSEPYILDATPDVLSIVRICVEDGYAVHWEPYSLAPTMITADGTVVTLISRDCCPYLDDHEPNYVNPAVAAPQEVGHSVTWDPDFVSDEISASAGSRSSKRKLANSASAGSESYIGGAQFVTDGQTLTMRTNMTVCPLSISRKRENTHLEVKAKMK